MRRQLPLLLLASCGDSTGLDGETTHATPSSGVAASTANPSTSSSTSTTGTVSHSSDATSNASTGDAGSSTYERPGPYDVGIRTSTVSVGGRDLHVTFWYPSDDANGTTSIADLVPLERRDTMATLLDEGPRDCVRSTAAGVLDAPLADGVFPTVLVSHCHSCLGLSSGFIAERMASHGHIVVGVSHTGGTLFDALGGTPGPLDGTFLQVRAADIRGVLDTVSTGSFAAQAMDLEHVGVFGHSFGATTAGYVLQEDERFSAGVAIAAPIENPLIPGVSTADVGEPMLYLSMEEDNSISAVGNTLMRNNAMAMPGGSWLVELADAGHWSPSDLCGLVDDFMPCCGDDIRQTDGTPFTYLPADDGRAISAAYVTAFFVAQFEEDAQAVAYLEEPHPADIVTVSVFPP